MSVSLSQDTDDVPTFLSGGGEMGQRLRAFDWSRNSLGTAATWPQSLRAAFSICLNSSFPIAIYWGKDLALLYNDDWSPILLRAYLELAGRSFVLITEFGLLTGRYKAKPL